MCPRSSPSLAAILGPMPFFPRTLRSHLRPGVPTPPVESQPERDTSRSNHHKEATPHARPRSPSPWELAGAARPPEYLHTATGREGPARRRARGPRRRGRLRGASWPRREKGQGPGPGPGEAQVSARREAAPRGAGPACPARFPARGGGRQKGAYEGRRSLALTSSRLGRRHLEELSFKLARSDRRAPLAGTRPRPPRAVVGGRAEGLEPVRRADVNGGRPRPQGRARLRPRTPA